MIIDACTYNGEKELFDLRYNILKDYVDEFIVVEFDKTFSGKDKEWKFPEIILQYPKEKIKYFPFTENDYLKYMDMARASPNTIGAEHWKREFCQKESIKDALIHLKDDDLVFIGDCDEIWDKKAIEIDNDFKLRLWVYTYYLNNKSSEIFYGTYKNTWGNIKEKCLNHLRSKRDKLTTDIYGWHFTSLKDNIRQKLTDSYTKETYANDFIMNNLDENVASNKDFLGRDFTFTLDESKWPQYLKDNKQKYNHLIK